MLNLVEPTVKLFRCQNCLYVWKPRVEAPSYCPNCGIDFRYNPRSFGIEQSDENGSFDYIDKGS